METPTMPDADGHAFRLLTTHKLSLEHSPSGKAVDIVAPDGRCLTADAHDPADIRRAIAEAAAYVGSQHEPRHDLDSL